MNKLLDFQGTNHVTPRHHTIMELHKRVRLLVIKTSFYEISQLLNIHLDHILIVALIEVRDLYVLPMR